MKSRVWVKGHYRQRRRARGSGCVSPSLLAGALAILLALVLIQGVLAFPALALVPVIALLGWGGMKLFLWRRRRKRQQMLPPPALDSRYIPDALRQAVLARDAYRCCACGSASYLELDHIIPRSRGGATSYENLQVLCRQCNLRKGNR